jgi:hypothetical protein
MFDDMDRGLKFTEFVPFLTAVVTGSIGGCVAGISHRRNRREVIAGYMIAYAITGGFGALMALAGMLWLTPDWLPSLTEILLISGGAGVCTALSLAAGNLTMRIVLKQLGIDVTIQMTKKEPQDAQVD